MIIVTYCIFVTTILIFLGGLIKHRQTLSKTKIEFYANQVSVADFTLKANIHPDLWEEIEDRSSLEYMTSSDFFLTRLRTELERLAEESDAARTIQIAFIEFENWTA